MVRAGRHIGAFEHEHRNFGVGVFEVASELHKLCRTLGRRKHAPIVDDGLPEGRGVVQSGTNDRRGSMPAP